MPEPPTDLYTASCNPPRRAKRSNAPAASSKPTATATDVESHPTPSHSQLRAILPMKAYTPRESATAAELEPPPPPAKRGRKPGPLSRSAREAQRRLNHSIIEKARRTKINDALATLKQLVPANYGQPPKPAVASDDEEDDDDDDGEYEDGSAKTTSKSKAKAKPSGKKEEKEKEFKLEILVRTVAFLQDLLGRIAALEASALTATPVPVAAPSAPARPASPNMTNLWPTCPNCSDELGTASQPKKRKRLHVDDEEVAHDSCHPHQPGRQCDPDKSSRQAKIPRRSGSVPTLVDRASASLQPCTEEPADNTNMDTESSIPVAMSIPILVASAKVSIEYRSRHRSHTDPRSQPPNESSERLPPISSWLPDVHPRHASNPMIDPQLFPPANPRARSHSSSASPLALGPSPVPKSYLPSPPASTHFDPVRSSTIPPLLNLGPVATASMVGSSTTPGSSFISTSTGTGADSSTSSARPRSDTFSAHSARTPEDESAASLLLQISTSPTFRPVSSSSDHAASYPLSATADPSRFWLHSASDVRSQPPAASHSGPGSEMRRGVKRAGESERRKSQTRAQAQTPSSLLGLSTVLHGRQ